MAGPRGGDAGVSAGDTLLAVGRRNRDRRHDRCHERKVDRLRGLGRTKITVRRAGTVSLHQQQFAVLPDQ